MAKKDYLPKDQDDRDTFLEKWNLNIPTVLTDLSLSPTHADGVKAKILLQRTSFSIWKVAKDTAASKSDDYQLKNADMENILRVYNQNLKTTNGYSTTIGALIGIEGPEHTFDPVTAQPTGSAKYVGGEVVVKFNHPREVDMVEILSRRGSETAFTFLANDTNSPYNDSRSNLTPGTPEKREYQIWFIIKGNRIGVVSQTITVTVP